MAQTIELPVETMKRVFDHLKGKEFGSERAARDVISEIIPQLRKSLADDPVREHVTAAIIAKRLSEMAKECSLVSQLI